MFGIRTWLAKSLRRRLVVANTATVVLFVLVVGIFSFYVGRRGVELEITERDSVTTELAGVGIRAQFDHILDTLEVLSYQPDDSREMLAYQARAMLGLRFVSPLTYRAFYLFDQDGDLLFRVDAPLDRLPPLEAAEELLLPQAVAPPDEVLAVYQAVHDLGQRSVSEVEIVGVDRIPVVYIGLPVRGRAGLSRLTLVATIDLRDIWRQIDVINVGQTGRRLIVDSNGIIIVHSDRAYIGQTLAPELQSVLEGFRGQADYIDPISGRRMLATYTPVGGQLGWGMVVEQEYAEAFAQLNLIALITGGVLLLSIVSATGLTWLMGRGIALPILSLAEATRKIAATGDLQYDIAVRGQDEVGQLAATFNQMVSGLRQAEEELATRAQILEEQVRQRAAVVEVSQVTNAILDAEVLLQQAVDLIRERFGLYYVGLFLKDATGTWAVLRAGTGSAGAAMLARGHRIKLGEGMIGWSVAQGESRVAAHAGADAVRLATEELPQTRSEAAIPLRSRGVTIGALTVQDDQEATFDENLIQSLQIMADQVAVAIDNARLLREAQAALEAEKRAYGELSARAWTSLLTARAVRGYIAREDGDAPVLAQSTSPAPDAAPDDGEDLNVFALPIQVRGNVLGTLRARKAGTWSSHEAALLEDLGSQLGSALEGARLYEDTQRRAAREQAIRAVTDEMQLATDLESLMRITTQELIKILGGSHAYVQMIAETEDAAEDMPPAADPDAPDEGEDTDV